MNFGSRNLSRPFSPKGVKSLPILSKRRIFLRFGKWVRIPPSPPIKGTGSGWCLFCGKDGADENRAAARKPQAISPRENAHHLRQRRRFKRISGRVRLLVLFFSTSLTPGQPSGSIRTCRGKTPPFASQTQIVMCVPLSPTEMLLPYANQRP